MSTGTSDRIILLQGSTVAILNAARYHTTRVRCEAMMNYQRFSLATYPQHLREHPSATRPMTPPYKAGS